MATRVITFRNLLYVIMTQPFDIIDVYKIKSMKKSLKLYILAISSLLAIFQTSCNSDNDSSPDCNNINCTEEFRTIIVSIKDQNQNPIVLDYFEVTNLESGSDLTIPLSSSGLVLAQQYGQYPLIADGGVEINQILELEFKGFINDIEVIRSDYSVSADCCHVVLIFGNIQLVLE